MKINFRKIGLALGIICACIFIGTSVSGWIRSAKDNKTEQTTEETAYVQVVAE